MAALKTFRALCWPYTESNDTDVHLSCHLTTHDIVSATGRGVEKSLEMRGSIFFVALKKAFDILCTALSQTPPKET